jgi:hypothetical protein
MVEISMLYDLWNVYGNEKMRGKHADYEALTN